jgi:glycosyltransferase involved in cell wall biosynthesis
MRSPRLCDLPAAPAGKTGWPWTEESALPQSAAPCPRISVVTPSFNQAHFLEETIRSILLQSYPEIELLIIDGGSTDGSLDLIRRYAPWIAYWVSEKDRGQSHALNKGFAKASGQWIGWQNSDDIYHPNCFNAAAAAQAAHPDAAVLYGQLLFIDAQSRVVQANCAREFRLEDGIPWFQLGNQSLFFRRDIFEAGLFLDESFHHCMDSEFYWRLIFAGYKFQYDDRIGGSFRLHEGAKTAKQQNVNQADALRVFEKIFAWPKLDSGLRGTAIERLQAFACVVYDQGNEEVFDAADALLRQHAPVAARSRAFRARRLARPLGALGRQAVRLGRAFANH